MWDAIYSLVERNATWPVLALLFILFLLCFAGFQWRNKVVGDTLEGSVCYTPGKASKILHAMGDRGRNIYALTEITLDFVFPFIYGGLFAILLFHVYSRGNARWLLLIPFITVVADLLENFTAAYLAWSFKEGESSPLAWAATTFTIVKTALFILSLVLILIGALGSIWSAERPSG